MQYRNFRSDFNVNETFFRIQDGAKVAVNVPERLRIDYFTEEGRNVFTAARDGNSCTGCSLSQDGKTLTVHLSLRSNPVGCGRLQKLVTEIHPDPAFPDGERHTLIPGDVDVILYKGKTGDLDIPESEVVIVDGIFTIDTSDFLTEIPVATPSRLGGVKIGDGLCVAQDGLLAVDFEKAVTKEYLQGVIDSLPDIPDVSGFATITDLDALSARVSVLEQRINWDDIFGIDSDGNVYVKKRMVSGTEVPRGFFTYGFLSGGGLSDTEPSGGATTLAELQDVYLSSLANGQLLMYDATLGKWKNVAQSAIVPDLSNYYLPLTGGIMTGAITMPTGSSALSANGIDFGTVAHLGASTSFGIYSTGSILLRPGNGTQSGSYGVVVGHDSLTYNGNTVYHAGNLTIATLLGSSAIGSASRPVYYSGSGFAGITSLDLLSQNTGYVKANRLYLNASTYFEVVDGNVHLVVGSGKGFWTDGFMSSGGLSDTPGGSGIDPLAMWKLLTNNSALAAYDNNTKIATAHLPTLGPGLAYSSSGSGSSLATTLSIASDYKLPTTTEWGNKADASALAGYVPISTPVTVSAAHTFSGGIILQSGTNWASTDRAIPFSMSGTPANIRYYYDDADKGLTFNPYSGALKAASFVKRGGTSSQFLKADGSVDSNAYALSSALGNYLPLAGGTMTGAITMPTGSNALSANGLDFGEVVHFGAATTGLLGIYATGNIVIRPGEGALSSSYGLSISTTALTYNSNTVYHAGNLTIATLLGSSAIGSASRPVYYSGSGFAGITSLDLLSQNTGYVKANRLYLNAKTYFEVVDGNVRLWVDSGKGFYTNGFMSSGGLSDTEPAGGIDALAMWKLLTNNSALSAYDNNTKIASAHIPVAAASAVGGIKVGSNLSISNGVLSATNTTYSAGTGLTLSGTTFSVTANTYAPYNANGYLPLNGGTMTGALNITPSTNSATTSNGLDFGTIAHIASATSGLLGIYSAGNIVIRPGDGSISSSYGLSITPTAFTYNGNAVRTAGDSYVSSGTGYIGGTAITTVSGSAGSLASGITLWGKSGINAGTSYGGDLTINNAAYLNFKDATGTGTAGRIGATSSDYFRIEGTSGISLRTGSTIATRMYVASTGNVGIGTTSPAYNFDVVGTGYFSTGAVIANGTSAGFRAKNSAGTADTTLMYLSSSDNLMVGTGTAIAGGSTLINGANITFRYYASGAFSEIARFTSDGYLGIGTTTPAYPLDVAGKIYASQGVNIANGYAFRSIDNPSSGEPTERALLHLSSGNICWVGYGMATPGYDTKVAGTNLELCYGSSRTTGATLTSTGDFQIANTLTITNTSAAAHLGFSRTGLNYITAPATGSINFVLGTTLSSSASVLRLLDGSAILNGTLSASDAITLSGTTAASRRIYFGDSSHYLELNSNGFHFSHGVYSDSFMSAGGLSDAGSYLGSVAEDIIPDATRTRNLGSSSKMWARVYAQYIDTQSSYALRICTAGTERMRFASSQPYVSIGNIATETGYSLVCAAKIKCTTLEQTSDARLKDILGQVELSVSDIANAPAVYFRWKQDGTLSAGSIAQYWAPILPWCVADSGKALSMDYGQIALLSAINLAKAVETQGEKITRLEKTVKAQQKEINRLRAKLS